MAKIRAWLDGVGIHLKGWDGNGEPSINASEIVFNGDANCGHAKIDLGIAWPAPGAGGVATIAVAGAGAISAGSAIQPGTWFAGALLSHRMCGGDCSHESFILERIFKPESWEKPKAGTFFAFCKTAYKPYDLAVTACLVIAKHHLGDLITVHSDGDTPDWADARQICETVLGYGNEVVLDFEKERSGAADEA